MELSLVVSFLIAAVSLALMPGPDNLLVVTESVTKGKRQGIGLSAGLASGVLVHTLGIATGVALILQTSPKILLGIKVLGALYMLYLAYTAFREKTAVTVQWESDEAENESFGKLFQKGVVMNVLNPKVTLFFIAFLPQFVAEEGWPYAVQITVLGALFMVQAFLVFSGMALTADKLRHYITSALFWQRVKWVKIGVLVALSLVLVLL